MGEINLSKAVRSNLLSLQSTAASMAQTQERLATGLKVNSALDNPSSFFTASALNSRASDMSNLLDAMSSGIKTIEAADNGLSSITKTVESMQSTLRQARQDKSFQTQSFTLDPSAAGQLQFSGGAIGSSPVSVGLGGGAGGTQSKVEASGDYMSPIPTTAGTFIDFTATGSHVLAGSPVEFTVQVNGTTSIQISINDTIMSSVGDGDDVIDDAQEFSDAIQQSLVNTGDDALATTSYLTGNRLGIGTTGGGASASFEVLAISPEAGALGVQVGPATNGSDGEWTFSISNGSNTANISLTAAAAPDAASARDEITAQLQAQGVTGITVGGAGDRIDLSGAADGSNDVTVSNDSGADFTFGYPRAVTPGTPAGGPTVDQLVTSINGNSSLSGKIRASNDNGKLRIENLSTEDLTVTGIDSNGEVAGGSGTATIDGNDVRKNLVKQFNDLRDQLDKFADDASFNGINLLRGDKLKLTFNETGTSTIEIQAKDADGAETSIDNMSLGIEEALDGSFDADDDIDGRLDKLSDVLDSLRSQSSSFGSNLSIVENRTDFTKSMINTLETGASNLTLADTNEEAANLLALQTRQQLSSTALSMASQQDQAVLRLF